MKRKVLTALVLAAALIVTPVSGMLSTIASASGNNTTTEGGSSTEGNGTGSNNNTEKPGPDNNGGQGTVTDPSGESDAIVMASDGRTYVSSVETNNMSSHVTSFAVATPKPSVNAAVGLSAAKMEAGQYVMVTVADSQCGELARQAVTNAASAVSAKLAAILEIDVDILSANGATVEEIMQLASPVELVVSAPSGIDGNQYDFAVVRLHDGKTDILPDLDSDPKTITFTTDKFSVYAVVYGEKGSFDAFKATAAKKDSVPKTGDSYPAVLPFAAAGIVCAAAAAVLLKKKKEA